MIEGVSGLFLIGQSTLLWRLSGVIVIDKVGKVGGAQG